MARLTYENARTLVYDPVGANRNATRMALYTLGFRHIETAATLESFAEQIIFSPPDLAICEAHGVDNDLCALIQRLRQGETGENPFVVIIVTAWDNSNTLVGRVVNSGADDLILRPFSVAQLSQRIRTHVERRKGFVVTSDYIGPDRRRNADRPSDVELFQPPNSLKMKVQENLTADAAAKRLESELAAVRSKFDSEKLSRDAFQICVLWRLLQDAAPSSTSYASDLAKLRNTTMNVWRRSRDTVYEQGIRWCESIINAIDGLERGVDRNASLHLLGNAALNLYLIFDPSMSANDRIGQIDATVAIINARNQMDMAG
jgi:DNA-binding response OmpR family regulator